MNLISSNACKFFVIKILYLLPQVMYSVFCVAPYADVTCIEYFLIDEVTKNELE